VFVGEILKITLLLYVEGVNTS